MQKPGALITFGSRYLNRPVSRLRGFSWGLGGVSAVDFEGRAIAIADALRDDVKRFVVHADEILLVSGTGSGDSGLEIKSPVQRISKTPSRTANMVRVGPNSTEV
jgi:hypothetical protein